MTDTPLTRAARALILSQSGCDSYDDLEPEAQERARETVRAVIGAIREPDDKRITDALNAAGLDGEVYWQRDFRAFFDALIDTALSE